MVKIESQRYDGLRPVSIICPNSYINKWTGAKTQCKQIITTFWIDEDMIYNSPTQLCFCEKCKGVIVLSIAEKQIKITYCKENKYGNPTSNPAHFIPIDNIDKAEETIKF